MPPDEFIRRFFVEPQGLGPEDLVTRIEWVYLDPPGFPPPSPTPGPGQVAGRPADLVAQG
jgi:hypothetical protein